MVWPWLPPRSWHDHRQDACTLCGQKRFVSDGASRALVQEMSDMDKAGSTGSALRLRPAKVFFILALRQASKVFSQTQSLGQTGGRIEQRRRLIQMQYLVVQKVAD